jgi:protein-tyrosine phosphatase
MHKRFVAALPLVISAIAHADVTQPVCTQTGPNNYSISFSLTGDSHTVSISASGDPSGISGRIPVLQTTQTEVTVTAGQPGQRMYFFLEPDHGRGREVSIRHIELQGTPNFRDIGGYETIDGHFVKWGLVYRTGVLSYLTPSDFIYLRQLGVRVVCDFRTHQENEQAPEQWIPDSGATMISLPIGSDNGKSATAGLQQFAQGHPTTDQFKQRMEKAYSNFVFEFSPEYARVFTELKQDHLPLAYHCTAGKDRTGIFTALLLRVLGVPMPTILDDYALTNRYFMSKADNTQASQKARAQAESMLKTFTPEQRQVLMAADPAYLKATFAAIDERYGSFDSYRRQALGLSDSDVSALRAHLLTNE